MIKKNMKCISNKFHKLYNYLRKMYYIIINSIIVRLSFVQISFNTFKSTQSISNLIFVKLRAIFDRQN